MKVIWRRLIRYNFDDLWSRKKFRKYFLCEKIFSFTMAGVYEASQIFSTIQHLWKKSFSHKFRLLSFTACLHLRLDRNLGLEVVFMSLAKLLDNRYNSFIKYTFIISSKIRQQIMWRDSPSGDLAGDENFFGSTLTGVSEINWFAERVLQFSFKSIFIQLD